MATAKASGKKVIRRRREKLEHDPAEPEHIMTKWGVGYYLKD